MQQLIVENIRRRQKRIDCCCSRRACLGASDRQSSGAIGFFCSLLVPPRCLLLLLLALPPLVPLPAVSFSRSFICPRLLCLYVCPSAAGRGQPLPMHLHCYYANFVCTATITSTAAAPATTVVAAVAEVLVILISSRQWAVWSCCDRGSGPGVEAVLAAVILMSESSTALASHSPFIRSPDRPTARPPARQSVRPCLMLTLLYPSGPLPQPPTCLLAGRDLSRRPTDDLAGFLVVALLVFFWFLPPPPIRVASLTTPPTSTILPAVIIRQRRKTPACRWRQWPATKWSRDSQQSYTTLACGCSIIAFNPTVGTNGG